jgi:prepilin-type N-terminal cleavage/methylation domain-containing protein
MRHGYTLIEMLVVLIIMGLAAALVAPSLLKSGGYDRQRQLAAIVQAARETAAKRSETIYVRVDPTGTWRMEGAEGAISQGRMERLSTIGLTLVVSPVGSCAFDVRSIAAAAQVVRLGPPTCDLFFLSEAQRGSVQPTK